MRAVRKKAALARRRVHGVKHGMKRVVDRRTISGGSERGLPENGAPLAVLSPRGFRATLACGGAGVGVLSGEAMEE